MSSTTETSKTVPIHRLGIALSGGGARGFAHAGALEALEEAGHKPDVIAGVSAGSVVAALYAAGMRPRKILEAFSACKTMNLINIKPKGGGMLSLAPFKEFIQRNLGEFTNIEDLPIPIFIGATDFERGVPAIFDKGHIAERVVASCSIPIAFPPAVVDGTRYVDGGVLRNHPAWIIREKCEFLIGINVSPLEGHLRDDSNSFLSVALRTYNLLLKANQRADMDMCDINIETPEISHYPTFDLRFIDKVYLSGYSRMRRALRDAGLWKCPLPNHN